ncbi:MAG: hypothetical protein HC806_04150 [Anaerolineae bacterium]|nr:hypothetical protein [Anaerolineae bacterium]
MPKTPKHFTPTLLAADYYALVQAALEAGQPPEKISLDGKTATVWVRGEGGALVEMTFLREDVGWRAE